MYRHKMHLFDYKLSLYSYRNHFHVINTIYAYGFAAVANTDQHQSEREH